MSRYARARPYMGNADGIHAHIRLPEKIKCKHCQKVKATSHYSNNQLAIVRTSLNTNPRTNPLKNGIAPCRDCVGGQVTELECIMCCEVKALDEFAGAQRKLGKNSDNATCLKCQSNKLKTRPHGDEHFDQVEEAFGYDEDEIEQSETSSISNIYQRASDSGLGIENITIEDSKSTMASTNASRSTTNQGWATQRPRGFVPPSTTPSVIATASRTWPGEFDKSRYGAPSVSGSVIGMTQASGHYGAPGTSSVTGSMFSNRAPPTKNDSKWAKAYNPNGKNFEDLPVLEDEEPPVRSSDNGDESEGEY